MKYGREGDDDVETVKTKWGWAGLCTMMLEGLNKIKIFIEMWIFEICTMIRHSRPEPLD